MRTNWEDMVTRLGLKRYFIFTGQVPYHFVPWYCGTMDICVAPLLREAGESSAVKLFEYLSCGKAVVMSDISNTGKEFLKSKAVILVQSESSRELGEGILKLLSDPIRRDKMGIKGRQFVLSKYDRLKLAQDLVELCEETLRK